ncbi:MAG: response regulator [Gammaproteobacteria bacterium]
MAGEQILVVEDQRAVAGALQMRLRGLGYDIAAVARDGFEAIEKATLLHPDLILMDIKLGDGMDGIQAAREIRTQLDIPVIFVSAYVDRELLERARNTSPAGFINKPFTTKDLLTTIDLALHRRFEKDRIPQPAETESKDAVLTTDVNGSVNYVSAGAERRLRRKSNHLIGRPLAHVIAEAYGMSAAQAQPIVTNVIENGFDETLLSETKDSGKQIADMLTPLRDAQGENFGAALKFSTPLLKIPQSGHTRALQTAIDALPVGTLLVSEDLRVLHLNNHARDIINHNKALEYANDKLGAREKVVQESLRELVETAAEKARLGLTDSSEAIFIKSPQQSDQIEAIATPSINDEGEVIVVLYLFDSTLERVVSHDILMRLYGLTKTEAKLVQLLVGGSMLDAAAQSLEISVNTARTHLKHVFHKTGINRQAELVHRIETGPAALLVSFGDKH